MTAQRKKVQYYVLECAVEGCDAEFYLNDIPVIRRGAELGKFYSGQSNQYLVDGVNELSIVINPGATPGTALCRQSALLPRVAPKGASASAALALYPFGAITGGPKRRELMRLEWRPLTEEPQVFPRVVSARASLGPLFGPWAWEQAPRAALDAGALAEIEKFVELLHLSLSAADPEHLIAHSAQRLTEIERAYELKPGERAELIRQATRSDAEQEHWGMQPLAKEQFDFRTCAQERMVEIISKDWLPSVREQPDESGGYSTYSMLLCKLKDKWHIIR